MDRLDIFSLYIIYILALIFVAKKKLKKTDQQLKKTNENFIYKKVLPFSKVPYCKNYSLYNVLITISQYQLQ